MPLSPGKYKELNYTSTVSSRGLKKNEVILSPRATQSTTFPSPLPLVSSSNWSHTPLARCSPPPLQQLLPRVRWFARYRSTWRADGGRRPR